MSKIKKNGIRVVRKSAHLTYKALAKGANFSAKVEDKATRIITNKDFSLQIEKSISVEQAVFGGIQYNIAPLNPALPAVGRQPKVTMLIPSLDKNSFFGGTATALIVAGNLANALGKPLRIVETLHPGGKEGLGDFLAKNNIKLVDEVEIIDVSARTFNRYGYIDLHPEDIFIASAWWDARLVSQLPLKHKFVYLIQDFEPIFYPNSSEYVLADMTYKTKDFIPLCNTKLMYDHMSNNGYDYIRENGLWFEPAVSRKSFGKSVKANGKKRIFLYGRPSVPRNLFYIALLALNEAFSSGKLDTNDWDIYMAGQDKIPDINLSTGVRIKNLGKMDMEDYSNFIRTVDVAISLMMAPHPNYPTLEFASVGAAVVTTSYKTKQDLGNYSNNILLADLSVQSISEKIIEASKMSRSIRLKNLENTVVNDNWNLALADQIKTIIKSL